MDILRSWLTDFASNDNGKKRTSFTRNEIIEKHQRIINFSEKVENLYTYIALLQFASNTIMICSLAFLIVSVSKELKLKYCSQSIKLLLFIAYLLIINLINSVTFYNIDKIYQLFIILRKQTKNSLAYHFDITGDWYAQRNRADNKISLILRYNESRSLSILFCWRIFE